MSGERDSDRVSEFERQLREQESEADACVCYVRHRTRDAIVNKLSRSHRPGMRQHAARPVAIRTACTVTSRRALRAALRGIFKAAMQAALSGESDGLQMIEVAPVRTNLVTWRQLRVACPTVLGSRSMQ
jgi:hypothetical protein